MMLGNIKFVSADTEINRIMNNKNQDVLFVGSVTYVSDNYFTYPDTAVFTIYFQ